MSSSADDAVNAEWPRPAHATSLRERLVALAYEYEHLAEIALANGMEDAHAEAVGAVLRVLSLDRHDQGHREADELLVDEFGTKATRHLRGCSFPDVGDSRLDRPRAGVALRESVHRLLVKLCDDQELSNEVEIASQIAPVLLGNLKQMPAMSGALEIPPDPHAIEPSKHPQLASLKETIRDLLHHTKRPSWSSELTAESIFLAALKVLGAPPKVIKNVFDAERKAMKRAAEAATQPGTEATKGTPADGEPDSKIMD